MHGVEGINIASGELAAIVAPPDFAVELILDYLNHSDGLLYVSGNSSLILPRFSRFKLSFDVRRAFTAYQLMQILEEAHQSMLFIEHDGFEDEVSHSFIEALFLGMREIARDGAAVIVYSYKMDRFMDFIVRNADRFIAARKVNGGFVIWDSGVEMFVHSNNRTLGDLYG